MSDIQCCHQIKVLTGQIPGPKGDITEEAREVLEETKANAEQASINAQSVNIRTFANVEEMKQVSNLKAGALVKTQGFYQSGDGGGADYVVTDNIGEDEADEASIIALQKGLYAKLLITDYINVKWFGMKSDDDDFDNTDIWNKIVAYIEKKALTKHMTTLKFPSGTFIFNSSIRIPMQLCNLIAEEKSTVIQSNFNSTMEIPNFHVGTKRATFSGVIDGRGECKGITFKGTGVDNSLVLMSFGDNNFNDGVNGYNAHSLIFRDCTFREASNIHLLQYNVYLNVFEFCSFVSAHSFVTTLEGVQNSGENMTYRSCIFSGGSPQLDLKCTTFQLEFDRCSFDGGLQLLKLRPTNSTNHKGITFNGCHFEPRNDNNSEDCFVKIIEGETNSIQTTINFNDCNMFGADSFIGNYMIEAVETQKAVMINFNNFNTTPILTKSKYISNIYIYSNNFNTHTMLSPYNNILSNPTFIGCSISEDKLITTYPYKDGIHLYNGRYFYTDKVGNTSLDTVKIQGEAIIVNCASGESRDVQVVIYSNVMSSLNKFMAAKATVYLQNEIKNIQCQVCVGNIGLAYYKASIGGAAYLDTTEKDFVTGAIIFRGINTHYGLIGLDVLIKIPENTEADIIIKNPEINIY